MQFNIHVVIFVSGHLAPEIESFSKLCGKSYFLVASSALGHYLNQNWFIVGLSAQESISVKL